MEPHLRLVLFRRVLLHDIGLYDRFMIVFDGFLTSKHLLSRQLKGFIAFL